MLRVVGLLSLKHFVAAIPAIFLWPIVAFDYYERRHGRRPDRWHWADNWLYRMGFVVMM